MISRERLGSEAELVADGALKYIAFDCLERFGGDLAHGMSTRLGGVSTGECGSLNLGYNRKDEKDNVTENYRRICTALGIEPESMVFSKQVHDSRLRIVTPEDRGKGFSRDNDITDTDGLLTVTPGITLVTFYADCVPVFLYDPARKAAALVHSGWRSTLRNIAGKAAGRMISGFGCSPGGIVAVLGPSIGSCCFEVGEDVYRLFAEEFGGGEFYAPAGPGKWKIDLRAIITDELRREGLEAINIHNSGICTVCRRDLFFSHRGDRGATGSLAAFMQIRS